MIIKEGNGMTTLVESAKNLFEKETALFYLLMESKKEMDVGNSSVANKSIFLVIEAGAEMLKECEKRDFGNKKTKKIISSMLKVDFMQAKEIIFSKNTSLNRKFKVNDELYGHLSDYSKIAKKILKKHSPDNLNDEALTNIYMKAEQKVKKAMELRGELTEDALLRNIFYTKDVKDV